MDIYQSLALSLAPRSFSCSGSKKSAVNSFLPGIIFSRYLPFPSFLGNKSAICGDLFSPADPVRGIWLAGAFGQGAGTFCAENGEREKTFPPKLPRKRGEGIKKRPPGKRTLFLQTYISIVGSVWVGYVLNCSSYHRHAPFTLCIRGFAVLAERQDVRSDVLVLSLCEFHMKFQ